VTQSAAAMSRIPHDVVAHIGGFCAPEDRRTCSTAHRSLAPVHRSSTSCKWLIRSCTSLAVKLDALLRYQPHLNELVVSFAFDADTVHEDDYAYVVRRIVPALHVHDNAVVMWSIFDISRQHVVDLTIDSTRILGYVNSLLRQYPGVNLTALSIMSCDRTDLAEFCAINAQRPRVRDLNMQSCYIGTVDVAALNAIEKVGISQNSAPYNASAFACATCITFHNMNIDEAAMTLMRSHCKRLRYLELNDFDPCRFMMAHYLWKLLDVMRSTKCGISLRGVTTNPLVVPLVQYLLENTPTEVTLVGDSAYVDMIMHRFTGEPRVKRRYASTRPACKSYDECVESVISPVIRLLWARG